MAFPTIATPSNAYHRPAAFRSVYIRASGEKWATLGSISGGVLNFPNFSENDSIGRNKAHAVAFTAKCNMKQASLTEIELLDAMCSGANDFLFKLSDAATVTTSQDYEGWVYLTAAQVGLKTKVVLDGTPENNRKIELDWSGSLLLTELSAAVKATISAADFGSTASSAETFYGIGTYSATTDGGLPTNAHMRPNGVSSITLDSAGGSSPQTMGKIKDFVGSLDFISDPDGLKRHCPYAMKIDIAYNWMQTDAANLLNLDEMVGFDPKIIITFLSGLVVTLDNVTGITTDYEVSGDFDKIKVVKFNHTGSILTTSFDGIVSGDSV